MDEFKKFLTENNPYAINILINLIDREIGNSSGEYLDSLKDLAKKLSM